jgi:hypothetical protein
MTISPLTSGLVTLSSAAAREPARGGTVVRKGQAAERRVFDRLRAALPDDYRLFPNVSWIARTPDDCGIRDGEADLVLALPERGFLVFETMAGEIRRDAQGRWWSYQRQLEPGPFEQARTSMHTLVRKLEELPEWPAGHQPIAGHAVPLPDVDLETAGSRLGLLGPDVEPDLVFDRAKLPFDSPVTTCRAVEHALGLWAKSANRSAPGGRGVAVLKELLTTPVELRSLLRSEFGPNQDARIPRREHGSPISEPVAAPIV